MKALWWSAPLGSARPSEKGEKMQDDEESTFSQVAHTGNFSPVTHLFWLALLGVEMEWRCGVMVSVLGDHWGWDQSHG